MQIIDDGLVFANVLAKRTATNILVFHHAEATICSVRDVHTWHKQNGWSGIGYHFFIRKNGTVFQGRPIDTIGSHAQGRNSDSIGVCFEGNLENEQMTEEQVVAGIEIAKYCRKLYPNIKLVRHKDVNFTACPGKNFQNKILVEGMKDPMITDINVAIKVLVDKGIISSADYWIKAVSVVKYLDVLIINMANKLQ